MYTFALKVSISVSDEDLTELSRYGIAPQELEEQCLLQYYADGMETECESFIRKDTEGNYSLEASDIMHHMETVHRFVWEISIGRIMPGAQFRG
jgi:hypothetical protein